MQLSKLKTSKNKISLFGLLLMALLISIEIILTRFLSINTPIIRISLGFIPVSIAGILYGPLWAGIAYVIGDLIGSLFVMPTAPFFPGFTLTAFLTGFTYGYFLHKKNEITWKEALLPVLLVCLIYNLCLDTLWLYILMGKGVLAFIPARIFKSIAMALIQLILIPIIYKKLISKIPVILK